MTLRTLSQPYYQAIAPHKFSDIFDSPHASLGRIKRELGELKARALVMYAITNMLDFINLRNSMNPSQIAQTAVFILEDYYYFKLDDLKMLFNMASKGRFGELYGRIDGQIILKWFSMYEQMRIDSADEQSYNEHQRNLAKEKENRTVYSSVVQMMKENNSK